MFTKYYNADGRLVQKGAPDALFWVQTETDCDLLGDTFLGSHLSSIVCLIDRYNPKLPPLREFREWEPAQRFATQLMGIGQRRAGVRSVAPGVDSKCRREWIGAGPKRRIRP